MRALLILAFAAALAACGPSGNGNGAPQGGMPPAEVRALTVQPQLVLAPFEYTGQTAGSREVEVRARVTGILLSRNFTEGARVTKGQSLYTIDPAPFQAALARAEADVGVAVARLDQARREAVRLRSLVADKFVSQKLYDDAASAEAIGEAELKAARARLTEARLNLEYTRVESPVTGIASRSLRSEGTLVSGSEVLLTTVTQVDPIWVNFGIPDGERLGSRSPTSASPGRPARAMRAPSCRTPRAACVPGSSCASRCAGPRARTRSSCRSARCSRGRRASSSTWWTRRAPRSRAPSRSASGRAATGSSPPACRPASA
jgi:membrane fusion protein (multidrug efflux system)